MARRTVFDMLSGMVANELEPLKQHLTKKARREWARKLIDKQPMARGGDSVDGNAAIKLLKAEHARAVRIVSQYMKRYGTEGSPCELICNDLLDLLRKGRA